MPHDRDAGDARPGAACPLESPERALGTPRDAEHDDEPGLVVDEVDDPQSARAQAPEVGAFNSAGAR